jgi:cytoskeleton protein RodZ
MSPGDSTALVTVDGGTDLGPGERLREAREAAQLSVAEVASRLRLEARAVHQLEEDNYDGLHGPTFVRGYLGGYARLLNLPERPIMEAYERRGHGPPEIVADIAAKPQVRVSDFPVRMITYMIVALSVVLMVLWWHSHQPGFEPMDDTIAEGDASTTVERAVPEPVGGVDSRDDTQVAGGATTTAATTGADSGDADAPSTVASAPGDKTGLSPPLDPGPAQATDLPDPQADVMPAPTATTRTSVPPPEAESPAPGGVGEGTEAMATTATADTTSSEPPAGEDSVAETTDSAAPSSTVDDGGTGDESSTSGDAAEEQVAVVTPRPMPLPGSDVLRIQLARESWVEIYDRGGGRLFYSLAAEGSEVMVQGAGPMEVLLGDVEGALVAYNEEPYDMARFQGRNVVRFTVGQTASATTPTPTPADGSGEPLTRAPGNDPGDSPPPMLAGQRAN